MTPEELRALIEKLKNENALALTTIDELMQKRDKKDDISKLDNDIDTLMQVIENRNKEIERYDKLLSLQTNSSMNKRNTADNLDNTSYDNNNDAELRSKVDRWFRTGNDKEIRETLQAGVAEGGGYTIAPQYLVRFGLCSTDKKKSKYHSCYERICEHRNTYT